MENTVGSDTLKCHCVLAFFKIEVVRLVVKTFLVLDRILYPAIIGYLSGTKIVVLVVTGYLSLVLPVTVERDVLCRCERIFAVYLKTYIKNGIL